MCGLVTVCFLSAQNTVMLGGAVTAPGQASGTPAALQPGSAAAAVTQRVGPHVGPGTRVTPTAITTVRELTPVFNTSQPARLACQ